MNRCYKAQEANIRFKIHKSKKRTEALITASWVFIALVSLVFLNSWGRL